MLRNFDNANGVYAITDFDNVTEEKIFFYTEQILKSGISALQYRDKKNIREKKHTLAKQLSDLCQQYQTPLIINDDLELAKDINAQGLHVGHEDGHIKQLRDKLPDKIIGVSCYNQLQLAIEAEQYGADYIAFGSFFPSKIKPNAVQADTNLLHQAKKILTIPVVAIGGISPENGSSLIQAGADYLAIISGLYQVDDPMSATQAYKDLWKA